VEGGKRGSSGGAFAENAYVEGSFKTSLRTQVSHAQNRERAPTSQMPFQRAERVERFRSLTSQMPFPRQDSLYLVPKTPFPPHSVSPDVPRALPQRVPAPLQRASDPCNGRPNPRLWAPAPPLMGTCSPYNGRLPPL